MFLKVVMRVLVQNESSDTDYYLAESAKIDVDYDSDEEFDETTCVEKKEKRWLIERAEELDAEPEPRIEELYLFLCEHDPHGSKSRYLEMIDCALGYQPFHNPRIYLEKGDVKISLTLETESLEPIEEMLEDDPFDKVISGSPTGCFCKFPSRTNPNDLLAILEIDAVVTRVTDLSGKTEWIEYEESEDETAELSDTESNDEEVKHPFYMTHEQLFGYKEVDLDTVEVPTPLVKKPRWSVFGMFKKA